MMNSVTHRCCCRLTALLAGLSMSFAAIGGDDPVTADFQAVGHEPGWQLAVDYRSRQLDFSADEGAGRYQYLQLGPDLHRGNIKAVTYRVVDDAHHMHVVVLEQFCQDSKSGKAYGATVNVRLDGRLYTGCGEPLVERSTDPW